MFFPYAYPATKTSNAAVADVSMLARVSFVLAAVLRTDVLLAFHALMKAVKNSAFQIVVHAIAP
jgi:hypothetical protein